MAGMSTPFESALLNLKLFDLRREPVLREARAWFIRDFNPQSLEELGAVVSSDRNASFRMVLGYWDMSASLVTSGAIDPDAFRTAHGEIFLTFAKVQPFLDDIRRLSDEPEFCAHLEKVVMSDPNAAAIMARRLAGMRAVTQKLEQP